MAEMREWPAATSHEHLSSNSMQSSSIQSAAMPGAGAQNSAAQSGGAEAAGAHAVASGTGPASAVLPAPQQASALSPALPHPAPPQPSASTTPEQLPSSGQLQVKGNSSELKINVQLPELGKIEVRAVTAQDVTTAHLTATHHEALQMLAGERGTLEQALKSRDVILGSWNSQGGNSHAGNSQSQGQPGGEQRRQSLLSSVPSSGGEPSTAAAATTSTAAEAAAGLRSDYSRLSVRA